MKLTFLVIADSAIIPVDMANHMMVAVTCPFVESIPAYENFVARRLNLLNH